MIEHAGTRYDADSNGLVVVADPLGRILVTLPASRQAEIAIWTGWNRRDVPRQVPVSQAVGVSVPAFVNDSRWVVQCPTCNGAQYASKTDRRFFCVDCLNVANGGQWIAVAWPDDPTVTQIETLLTARSEPATRAWLPAETVADLAAENAGHGVSQAVADSLGIPVSVTPTDPVVP